MDSTLNHPTPNGDMPASEEATLYRATAQPRLAPSGGVLFRAASPASRHVLEQAVLERCLRDPLLVRPRLSGYLPFLLADDEGADLQPVAVLSNGQTSLMRYATIVRKVPESALNRARQKALSAERARLGREPTEIEAGTAEARAFSDLLATALIDERESSIFYQHDSGFVFVAERSVQLAIDTANAIDAAIPRHSCRRVKFQTQAAATMSGWLRSGEPPAGFDFGESVLLTGAAKAKAKFDNHDLRSEEVVEHLNAGLQVQELQLVHGHSVLFTLATSGLVKGIKLLQDTPDDGPDGMSGELVAMLHFAHAAIPAIAAALAAVGGSFDDVVEPIIEAAA